MRESRDDRRGDYGDRGSEQFRKLFVGGLHFDTTEEALREYFERWGEVVDSVVMRDPHSKRSRGFGFVTFKEMEMVDDAQKARPHHIDGRDVEVKRAMPREDADRPETHLTVKKIFVSGVKDEIEADDLREYFSEMGNITDVDVIMDKETKRKRGFAFVQFDDYDPVDKAVLMKHHMIKGHRCDVRKALSKEEMRDSRFSSRGGRDARDRRGYGGRDDYDRGYGGRGYDRDYDDRDRYLSRRGWDDGRDGWGGGFGSSYGGARGGGPMRGEYGSRDSGPYGGGYGSSYGGYSSYSGGYGGGYGSSGYGGGYGSGDGYGGGYGGYDSGYGGYGGGSYGGDRYDRYGSGRSGGYGRR